MEITRKFVVLLIGSCGLSATISYIFTKKYYQKLAENEIKQLREYYIAKSFDEIEIVKDESEETFMSKPINGDDIDTSSQVTIKNYSQIYNDYISDLAGKEHPMDDNEYKAPRIIDGADFLSGEEYLDSTTLTYYLQDDVLIDDQFNEVFDNISYVGEENIRYLVNSDENVIYVVNDRLGMEYEVVLNEGKWDG